MPSDELMTPTLEEWCAANGYLYAAHVPGDPPWQVAFVLRTITGDLQLCKGGLSNMEGVSDHWSYDDPAMAIIDMARWEELGFVGEPTHWVRHQPSNRRRHWFQDGTKREWVAK